MAHYEGAGLDAGNRRASLRTSCPLPPELAGVNAARPAWGRSGLCGLGCWPFVIQHNAALREMGLNGPQRVTSVMSAPVKAGALRVLLRPRRAACPR
ncbi:hypothetical protein SEESL791_013650 [Salmonella enterica subsp. enterica serovar Sloterdijk str. ATCC 15791]|nr:hypothetical protein SEESL791_013595 [Salmonella enterica subsp. enterica serovar Sloterdijk str. ATCC 15791]AKW16166.1 hypothetical protein SEESL791_013650 [Salmonella enterica subsp. enterica serovar Sloterdijk str. ATCC 15791]